MKLFVCIVSVFFCFQPQPETRLKGIYKVAFDKKYELDGYKIAFNENTFVKTMTDAVTYHGKIKYDKYKTTISVTEDENPIEIDNREIGKDTIKFATKNKRDLSLTVNRGTMVRVKEIK